MKLYSKFIIILFLLLSNVAIACPSNSGIFVSYEPLFVPVQIQVDKNGVELSMSGSVVTPWGKFGIGYNEDFSSINNDCIYVVIVNFNTNKKTIYEIPDGNKMRIISSGKTDITTTPNSITIIVENGKSYRFYITEDSSPKTDSKFQIFTNKLNTIIAKSDPMNIWLYGNIVNNTYKSIKSIHVDNNGVTIDSFPNLLGLIGTTPVFRTIKFYANVFSSLSESDKGYYVQLFSTVNEKKAKKMTNTLKKNGLLNIKYLKNNNGEYKIVSGPYAEKIWAINRKKYIVESFEAYSDSFIFKIE